MARNIVLTDLHMKILKFPLTHETTSNHVRQGRRRRKSSQSSQHSESGERGDRCETRAAGATQRQREVRW